jgi:hypothetical protein
MQIMGRNPKADGHNIYILGTLGGAVILRDGEFRCGRWSRLRAAIFGHDAADLLRYTVRKQDQIVLGGRALAPRACCFWRHG